ncbi:MAG TPA: cupin domain-containing protein [Mycobacteriales bacterium]|nr:cupin domain-containing protein [Mycobacteriales bacterium]
MSYYRSLGDVPRKRHSQHRNATGGLFYEELVGEEGFSSDSSLLYHRNIPAAVVDVRPWEAPDTSTTANVPLKARHWRTHELKAGGDAVTGRHLLLGNADVRLAYAASTEPSPLYRNAIGDECAYVESGAGTLETMFGALPVTAGDYVVIPRGTVHRWLPSDAEPLRTFLIESSAHITPPKKFLSAHGQLLEHAPYCERDLHGPVDLLTADGSDVDVYVKHRGGDGAVGGTVMTYANHPFDVVGWDGCLYPYTFSIHDYEPITGRVHQPPPAHQVFEGAGFVVCNFVPRKVDYHPLAIPVPYYHSNVDSDEVLFYAGGDYAARKGSGIGQGSISLHPGGTPHGPQPGAYERSIGVTEVDELAVMVDTFRPLLLGAAGADCEDADYFRSWARPEPR